MFPRPAKDDMRYRPELAAANYWITTVGTALRATAEIATGIAGVPALRVLVAVASFGQLAGAALFVINMWWRVRMPVVATPPPR